MKAIAWIDGSASNQTHAQGGYGIVLRYYREEELIEEKLISGGSFYNTTSARQEIRALLALLIHLNKEDNILNGITVFCDNQYVVNTIAKRWLIKWKREKFKDRKNADLWKSIDRNLSMFERRKSFNIKWVRGHDDCIENEIADRLAKAGGQHSKKINDCPEFEMKLELA